MTFATYNIHVGVPMGSEIGPYKSSSTDLDNITSTINALKPDIVALQEVDCEYGLTLPNRRRSALLNQAKYLAGALEMNYIFGSAQDDNAYPSDNAGYIEWGSANHWTNNARDHGEVGNALLSYWSPIKDPENLPLPKDDNQERRACIRAEFQVPGKDAATTRTIISYATHLQHNSGSTRFRQMQAILEYASKENPAHIVVIAGDMNHELNATESENPISLVLKSGFFDLSAPSADVSPAAAATFPANIPEIRIDYIFCNQKLKVLQRHVQPSLASDHLPLAVTVELP